MTVSVKISALCEQEEWQRWEGSRETRHARWVLRTQHSLFSAKSATTSTHSPLCLSQARHLKSCYRSILRPYAIARSCRSPRSLRFRARATTRRQPRTPAVISNSTNSISLGYQTVHPSLDRSAVLVLACSEWYRCCCKPCGWSLTPRKNR